MKINIIIIPNFLGTKAPIIKYIDSRSEMKNIKMNIVRCQDTLVNVLC